MHSPISRKHIKFSFSELIPGPLSLYDGHSSFSSSSSRGWLSMSSDSYLGGFPPGQFFCAPQGVCATSAVSAMLAENPLL